MCDGISLYSSIPSTAATCPDVAICFASLAKNALRSLTSPETLPFCCQTEEEWEQNVVVGGCVTLMELQHLREDLKDVGNVLYEAGKRAGNDAKRIARLTFDLLLDDNREGPE